MRTLRELETDIDVDIDPMGDSSSLDPGGVGTDDSTNE
jgi:hypothetical protein